MMASFTAPKPFAKPAALIFCRSAACKNGIANMVSLGQSGISTWNEPERYGSPPRKAEVKMTDMAVVYGTIVNNGSCPLNPILKIQDNLVEICHLMLAKPSERAGHQTRNRLLFAISSITRAFRRLWSQPA
jgi:hypothetical protein